MTMERAFSHRIVLARRPQGAPTPEDFRAEQTPMPVPGPGQVLLRTLYLSLDPYMRGRMSEGPSYVEPLAVGDTMCGGAVCRVESSSDASLGAGNLVLSNTGWQDYAVAGANEVTKIDSALPNPSYALGVLGMPGLAAYVGLLDIGQPKSGETVVVAAATGAVGSVVGQIAKLKGCRVVGIAGGREKCDYAVQSFGFDACLDHHRDDLLQRLAQACPRGIDIYFENVGGAVLDAVLPLLNIGARVPLCGLIAYYNLQSLPTGVDHTPLLLRMLLVRRIKVQGFIVFDHYEARHADFARDMAGWMREGRIRYREEVVEGLENAPRAFIGLLRGDNFGKLVVKFAAA